MKIPQRRCAGCRTSYDVPSLIRIVRTSDGQAAVDTNKPKLEGRGVYLCKSLECFKKVKKSSGINRALKCKVAPEIYDEVEKMIPNE